MGLAESAVAFFPDAVWQRCVVHWYRTIFSHVPSTKVREVGAILKATRSEDIVAACEKAVRVIDKLRGLRLVKAAELAEAAVEETLTYYAFPEEHWRRIRTTDEMDKDFLRFVEPPSSPFFCSTRGGRSSVPTAHLRPPRAGAVKAGRVYRPP